MAAGQRSAWTGPLRLPRKLPLAADPPPRPLRFLVDDLNLALVEKEEPKQPEVAAAEQAPAEAAAPDVEELIHELKEQFTIVIVTHSMQQAARVSDRTAFFYLGKQIEYDTTKKIFMNPTQPQTEAYISGRFG